ncbi:MAG: WecB/TagA/CpsF family glycosyltransferase [Patescibacteria group bacterium]|jgi:N-acetylglucosaminyldiphosphoundecaprenol N-acetyl-beta-D-mannosaminyltransferase
MGRKGMSINGVYIDAITRPDVRNTLRDFLQGTRARHVVTINPEFLAAAAEDDQFRADLNSADLSLADGFGVVLASFFLGKRLPARTTGHDVMHMLAALSEEQNASIFLYGGFGSRVHRAAAALKKAYPKITLVGADTEHRFWGWKLPEWAIRHRIQLAAPAILIVGLGAGKQERWIRRNLPDLPSVKIAVGVGGVFDVWSGAVARAPRAFQVLGLEWAWRVFKEPHRVQRIITATLRFPLSVIRLHYRKTPDFL